MDKMSIEPPSVLIITLDWKQPEMTIECIQTLRKMTYSNFDYLVIEQESNNESIEILEKHFPMYSLIVLEENVGFAKGCNIGLKIACEREYDYALLINNDAFPAADMLEKLVSEIEPNIALLSPKIYYESEPNRIWFANGRRQRSTLNLRDTGRGEIDNEKWGQSRDVDYLLGTCLLVNLKKVEPLGFFNEQYFMYYEDLDWSIRLRNAGYRLRLVSSAHLYHRVATSSGGMNAPHRQYHLARSSFIFFFTHRATGNAILILIGRIGSGVKRITKLSIMRNIVSLKAYLRGLADGYKATR